MPIFKFRIVHVAFDRKRNADLTLRILQQGDRQTERKTERVLAVHLFAELKMLNKQLMRCREFIVGDPVIHFEIHLAVGKFLARIFPYIRSKDRHHIIIHGKNRLQLQRLDQRFDEDLRRQLAFAVQHGLKNNLRLSFRLGRKTRYVNVNAA